MAQEVLTFGLPSTPLAGMDARASELATLPDFHAQPQLQDETLDPRCFMLKGPPVSLRSADFPRACPTPPRVKRISSEPPLPQHLRAPLGLAAELPAQDGRLCLSARHPLGHFRRLPALRTSVACI